MIDQRENFNHYEGMKCFNEYVSNVEEYNLQASLRNSIRKSYDERIKNGEINIKCEISRLKLNIFQAEQMSSHISEYAAFCTAVIALNGLFTTFAQLASSYLLKVITGVILVGLDGMAVLIYRRLDKKRKEKIHKFRVLQVALETLEEMQQEREEEEQKAKEEEKKLEKQEKIEGYINRRNITNELAKEAIKELAVTALNKTNVVGKSIGRLLGKRKE